MKNRRIKQLESWDDIWGALADTSRCDNVYVIDLDKERVSMALYLEISILLKAYNSNDAIIIETYKEKY